MRSRILVGGLCAAFVLLTATGAMAQDVFSGRSIAPDKVKAFTVVTDTSMILEVLAIAANERTDLDILITTEVDGEDEVIVDSRSGVLQTEKATAGLLGATTYKVAVWNYAGPTSRWTVVFSSPGGTDTTAGARLAVRAMGEFAIDGRVDPELAGLQRRVQERSRTKNR